MPPEWDGGRIEPQVSASPAESTNAELRRMKCALNSVLEKT
jgi:hypothetical protein